MQKIIKIILVIALSCYSVIGYGTPQPYNPITPNPITHSALRPMAEGNSEGQGTFSGLPEFLRNFADLVQRHLDYENALFIIREMEKGAVPTKKILESRFYKKNPPWVFPTPEDLKKELDILIERYERVIILDDIYKNNVEQLWDQDFIELAIDLGLFKNIRSINEYDQKDGDFIFGIFQLYP